MSEHCELGEGAKGKPITGGRHQILQVLLGHKVGNENTEAF